MQYGDVYPEFGACVAQAADVVRAWRGAPAHELEVRLGTAQARRFEPGVPSALMHEVVSLLDTNTTEVSSTPWRQVHDYYYACNGRQIRTRVHFNSDDLSVVTKHVEKRKVMQRTFRASHAVDGAYRPDLRVALSEERVVDAADVPNCVQPSHVRLRQRKSYLVGRCVNDRHVPDWRFDFTMSWDADTRDAAELLQKTQSPVFEVECELINPQYTVARSDEHIATSLLLKVKDLIADTSIAWTPEEKQGPVSN